MPRLIATRQHSAGFVGTSPSTSQVRDVLVLFGKGRDWDEREYSHQRHDGAFRFHHEGFDLFSFPSNARLMWFDILRFVDRMVAKYGGRVQAVVSNNEQFGALAAALIAQRLGLPGTDPRAILHTQHKFQMRERLRAVMPEANPSYAVFPYTFQTADDLGIEFPFFVKPIKAAYSVLARRVENFAELREHMTFRPFEKHIIKRLVRPFNDAFAVHGGLPESQVDAHWMIGETLLTGEQINVDGLVFDGECHVLGIVDAIMYPGTQAFMRFDYPSQLPDAWQERVTQVACRAMKAMGHDHGFFNIEMTVDRTRDEIKIIEINPRMADQFSRLYSRIDGLNLHDLGLDMALGRRPDVTRRQMEDRVGASFVFRRFSLDNLPTPPTREQMYWLAGYAPHAILADFFKTGSQLTREMKWLGSYRYAVLNLTAPSHAALMEKYETIRLRMGFDVSAEDHLQAPRTLA
ncbi:MAG: ATP-grasp domain-containing protein [Burkholderiales bacterium]|nr:ATP-grasp domain-containing protein [Burkholderiales bacterium]